MVNKQYIPGGSMSLPLVFFLILFGLVNSLQAKDFYAYRDKIFARKFHLHLNTPLSFSPRAKTNFSHPDIRHQFYPSVNFRFGLSGIYNFNPKYAVKFGLNLYWFSFNSMRYDFFVPKKYLEILAPQLPENYRGDIFRIDKFEPYNYFFSLPVQFEHRIPVSNLFDFRYGIGLDMKLCASVNSGMTGVLIDEEGKVLLKTTHIQYMQGNDRRIAFRPDALLSAGVNRYLKNNKILNINFLLSIPLYKPLSGEFAYLLDTPYEARGTFRKSDLAFGFELNYIFTFVRKDKRLDKKAPAID